MKFHSTKAMQRRRKKNQSFICFFQRLGKKPGVIFLQLGLCVCCRIFPHLNHPQGSSSCFTFKGREDITLTPTGKRKMPHCNSPPGSRNKGITYACIMENFLTQTRQKTSLFFTRHLKPCASQVKKPSRQTSVFYVKPLDGLSRKLAFLVLATVKRKMMKTLIPQLYRPFL